MIRLDHHLHLSQMEQALLLLLKYPELDAQCWRIPPHLRTRPVFRCWWHFESLHVPLLRRSAQLRPAGLLSLPASTMPHMSVLRLWKIYYIDSVWAENILGKEERTNSWILRRTNCNAHSKLVISTLLGELPGSEGISTSLILPIVLLTSMTNLSSCIRSGCSVRLIKTHIVTVYWRHSLNRSRRIHLNGWETRPIAVAKSKRNINVGCLLQNHVKFLLQHVLQAYFRIKALQ